ncbi:ABC transporter substrate-binding protein [Halorussus halobius]|uniref:ABC transporter substrate-binding protein n=1 Tax=Halorussus halobius TaxID=1710537 RepID=UPI00109318DC|nr:PotD/PotF family extracellular solute-binding protein [Halorussus halobius]
MSDEDKHGRAWFRPTELNRRRFLKATGVTGLASTAGCLGVGGGDDGGASRPIEADSVPPSEYSDELNVWNWYFSWRDWAVENFQNEIDVTVNKPSYSSGAEVYSKFESGDHSIDNVGLTTDWTNRAMNNDHLEPLPVDEMDSWQAIPEYVKESTREYKSKDGDVYAMPQAVSIFPSLTYNTEVFDGAPESWSVLWDDAYEGQILMRDSATSSCSIAAWYTGQDPFDPDDFDEIEEVLEQQKPLVNTYWSGYNQARGMFTNEDAVVGPLLDGQTFLARFDNDAPINFTVPEEGTYFNVDDIVIPKGAPNPMTSLYFVDWAMQPAQSKQLLLTMGYLPPVQQENLGDIFSEELDAGDITEEELDFYRWPDEWDDRLVFGRPFDDEVRERYDEIWTAVKSS